MYCSSVECVGHGCPVFFWKKRTVGNISLVPWPSMFASSVRGKNVSWVPSEHQDGSNDFFRIVVKLTKGITCVDSFKIGRMGNV